MKCKYKNDYIIFADYITGKLSETKRAELETHLLECEQCRQKADAIEKASWVIQVEGQTLLEDQPGLTLNEKVKDFFNSLSVIKLPKLAYTAIALMLTFSIGSWTLYNTDVDKVYSLAVNENTLSGMRGSEPDSNSTVKQRAFEQFISEGQNAFMQENYDKALDIYYQSQSFLQDTTVVDSLQMVQRIKLEYNLAVTKMMLWQSQPPGYFKWLSLKVRDQQLDTSLLQQAEAHLEKVLRLSEFSKSTDKEQEGKTQHQTDKSVLDKDVVTLLLSSIRDKINS